MPELKTCPFCGHTVELIKVDHAIFKKREAYILCKHCGLVAYNEQGDTMDAVVNKVIEQWNRRVSG
jgi:Lar family restriction alleviation protein